MKKLIYLLPLLMLIAGCVKTDIGQQPTPLVPYGTFTGKFTRTHTDQATSALTTTTANIKLVMTEDGFTLTSTAVAVHANGSGDFLGDELNIQFSDVASPTIPDGKTYLHGFYTYLYDGNTLKLSKQSGDDAYLYEVSKY